MRDVAQLSYHDLLVERPFTDPDHVASDSAILLTAAKNAWSIAKQTMLSSGSITPQTIFYPEAEQWQKRTMLLCPSTMLTATSLTVVGFFGNKRTYVDMATEASVIEVGQQLCHALHQQNNIVCYVSKLLADAYNYANLVLIDSEQTIGNWRENEIHQQVTSVTSPKYYYNVRIYNGTLSITPQPHQLSLQLTQVKYFDYTSPETWYGIRQLSEPPAIMSTASPHPLTDQEVLQ